MNIKLTEFFHNFQKKIKSWLSVVVCPERSQHYTSTIYNHREQLTSTSLVKHTKTTKAIEMLGGLRMGSNLVCKLGHELRTENN